jgi:hypothetical protein
MPLARRSVALVALLTIASACSSSRPLGPIPANWKTFRGNGFTLRYPPTSGVLVHSSCSLDIVENGSFSEPNEHQPCSAYAGPPAIGMGLFQVSLFLFDPSKVTAQARAHAILPPLRLSMVSLHRVESTNIVSGASRPPSDIGTATVRMGGHDYGLDISIMSTASDQERAAVDQIIASIRAADPVD